MIALFVAGLLILAVGIAILFVKTKQNRFLTRTLPSAVFVIIAVVLITVSCLRTVPTGHTGIVTVFGKVENETYEAGVHFTAPWKSVVNMDNRNQKASIDLSCFSSDIQEVSVTYTLNYQISKSNAQMIYKDIGISYYDVIILPRVQEAVKSELAKYTAEQLLSNRAQLSQDIRSVLTEKLEAYNIVVVDASMENLDFSDAFTDAVEAKQVAEQRSKQAQIEQDQKNMEAEAAAKRAQIEAEAEAKVAVIAANADLDVVKIQADAAEYAGQKDAAVIGQVRDIFAKDPANLTDEDVEQLLLYYYIQRWDGKLPTTYFSSEDFSALLAGLGTGALNGDASEGGVVTTPATP
ncbi:MAG: prohibitin family protein [Ruminococcaceae bacterium]|nr:prohibitin family protein [Oscillospiraceae bacterium]